MRQLTPGILPINARVRPSHLTVDCPDVVRQGLRIVGSSLSFAVTVRRAAVRIAELLRFNPVIIEACQ